MKIITQIKQKVANNKKIMQQIKELKNLSLERSLNKNEREIIIAEIKKLQISLSSHPKIGADELLNSIKKHELDGARLENIEVEYVLNKCIIKGEITLIVAPPGQGKSSFALSVASYCLS
ncbi:MAG: hypothetical protein PHS42_02660, partial [Sulfurimonas sp.]|nr:hypothetical protein [Sulfurimonas sp.]